ncbi:MAG: triose-phosphate isomerase [Candidatus Bipolaricaulia bacterium]
MGMRRPIVVANWKMYKTHREAVDFVRDFKRRIEGIKATEMTIAPPFTWLEAVGKELEGTEIRLAAQNVHFESEGPYTGEISPMMLVELGCRYVLVGHSERRRHFCEDAELIKRKLHAVFGVQLIPIFCIGESLEERRRGVTERVLERQLKISLMDLEIDQVAQMVISYEPIWAIGTGETAVPEDADRGAAFVRKVITELYGREAGESIQIQYGGSVTPETAAELIEQANVDGFLVGGASLDPSRFAGIIEAVEMGVGEEVGSD